MPPVLTRPTPQVYPNVHVQMYGRCLQTSQGTSCIAVCICSFTLYHKRASATPTAAGCAAVMQLQTVLYETADGIQLWLPQHTTWLPQHTTWLLNMECACQQHSTALVLLLESCTKYCLSSVLTTHDITPVMHSPALTHTFQWT